MIKPICVCFSYIENKTLLFNGLDGEIRLQEWVEECYEILKHCTGYNTVEEISEMAGIDITLVTDIVDFLLEYKIVYNSTQLYQYYQTVSSNPMYFRTTLSPTQISKLTKSPFNQQNKPVARSKSVRDFDIRYQPKSIEIIEFLNLVIGCKQVKEYPSAGGFYPVEVYVINSKENPNFPRGVYKFQNKALINQDLVFDVGMLYKAFESRELIHNSGFAIILVANLTNSGAKYCNRSYRYACLEAGHIAQNFYLKAKEFNLSICEYGGFCDNIITHFLSLSEDSIPITSLIIGKPSPSSRGHFLQKTNNQKNVAYKLLENYVPQKIGELQIRSYTYKGEEIPKFSAYTKFDSSGVNLMAFGNDYSINLAVIKALAESVERKSSGQTRFDFRSIINKKSICFLNPSEHIPLHNDYIDFSTFFTKFDINKKYEWIIGQRILDQSDVAVLADTIFYPFAKDILNRKPIHWASSNGVAAHTDRFLAIQNGLYELIERDAIMVNWYTQKPVNKIIGNIPGCVSDRVKIWREKYGYQVNHIDLRLDSLPVVVTTFFNPQSYPCFVAGAGCGNNYAAAIEKSFAEAEFMLTSWSENIQDKIEPEKVREVHDHASLYFYPDHLDRLHYLLDVEEKWVDVDCLYDINLLDKFNPIVIDLKQKDFPEDLCVVHVLSENLMPINFGYGLEAYQHKRIKELGLDWAFDYPAFPHYFA